MDCPNCGLVNPETAQRCDCGYDFPSKSLQGPYFNDQCARRGFEGWLRFTCVGLMIFQLLVVITEAVGFWRYSKGLKGGYAITLPGFVSWTGMWTLILIGVAIIMSPLLLAVVIATVIKRRKKLQARALFSPLILLLVLSFLLSMGSCVFTFGGHPLWMYGYG